ncbi:membrane protein [Salinisphaera orenii MK-B5]|uniref:Membrane protein n=1 Tax=Salinisphaera orenii MK-B5 TaxID=856730 RepID=A0A423PM42_9GAMM|nr:YIP1 family protein [Salinisphaera orenii]ROO26649.1 membrane protein [Salinisphaera orenii MK-B5]
MQSFFQRMLGAARLDVPTYEEVEHDKSATGQAAGVVALSALAAGVGAMAQGGIAALLLTGLAALLGWVIWAAIIWAVGTKLLPEAQTEADIGQLLRTLGFAAAPGVLRVFAFIPLIGPLVMLVVAVWMLATTVVAVRQALDYKSTWRAVGVCVIGWVVQLLIIALIGSAAGFGMGGPTPAPAA